MKRIPSVALAGLLAGCATFEVVGGGGGGGTPTPSPSGTGTPTPTPSGSGTPSATPALVQKSVGQGAALNPLFVTGTFANPVAAGDLILVFDVDSGTGPMGCSVGGGSQMLSAGTVLEGSGGPTLSLFYEIAPVAGSFKVSCTAADMGPQALVLAEFSGVAGTDGAFAKATGAMNAPSSGPLRTTGPRDLLVGGAVAIATDFGAGSCCNLLEALTQGPNNSPPTAAEYAVIPVATTTAATFTVNNPGAAWAALGRAFRAK